MRELADLNKEKCMLDEENEKLRSQISILREENKHLADEIRSVKSMIRILTKTDVETGSASPQLLNIPKIDRLLRKRTYQMTRSNDEHQENRNFNSNTGFKSDLADTMGMSTGRIYHNLPKAKRRKTKQFKNTLMAIEEHYEENVADNIHCKNEVKSNATVRPSKHCAAVKKVSNLSRVPLKTLNEVGPTVGRKVNGNKSLLKLRPLQRKVMIQLNTNEEYI
ncbi:hypothetical protein QAD02_022495 [Eretmocerus hayati]|uniref:Uncharacterized protein n=1 Tax=Eretmocerus hayati TaxID=131215 RepID=A0ACC2PUT3_9HYME|nr:hypothetical protein QAD02_022495 [Eretmocerus hayati]